MNDWFYSKHNGTELLKDIVICERIYFTKGAFVSYCFFFFLEV